MDRLFRLVAVALLVAAPATGRSNPEVDRLNAAIRADGLGWVASETSVSRLSPAERARLVVPPGVRPPWAFDGAPRLPNRRFTSLSGAGTLPTSFDWRNHKGRNWVTPIRDQGHCGACWAFASIATFETLLAWRTSTPSPLFHLSEQNLLDCSAASLDCSSGGITWSLSLGGPGQYLKASGVTSDCCWPYQASRGSCGAATPAPQNGCATCDVWKIDDYANIWDTLPGLLNLSGPFNYVMDQATTDEIKTLLLDRPVGASYDVMSDFNYYGGGVYEPASGATFTGTHAVSLVGWDDALQCWIVKNSWGADWGEQGFFRIRYGASSFGAYAFTYDYREAQTAPAFCTTGPNALPATVVLDAAIGSVGLKVANCGGGVLEWQAATSAAWLALETSTGAPVTQGSDVAAGGAYRLALTGAPNASSAALTLSGASNGPVTVTVSIAGSFDAGSPQDSGPVENDAGVAPDAGISRDSGPSRDGGTHETTDTGDVAPPSAEETGCGCSASRATSAGLASLAALGLAVSRRRRR